jgi:acetyl-CoA C-acetyltransferase
MSIDPSRTAVIVGVGEINDRPATPDAGLDPVALMAAAVRLADDDSGGGFLSHCDRLLIVPQISFRGLDVERLLPQALGLPATVAQPAPEPSGDTPVHHLNDAANAIGSGEAQVCVITGAEALRTAAQRAAAAGARAGPFTHAGASDLRRRYGVLAPSDIYPLYENASRAAWGQSLAEGQAETGLIWSLMSEVAAHTSQGAWLKKPMTPGEITEIRPDNRPIAFPYSKLMVANASVNQGAAVVVTSLARARDAGIPEDRIVYIHAGAAAHEPEDPLDRARWTTPDGMRVTLQKVMALNGLTAQDLDFVELYSCFPCVPKMARRVLGWPADRPATVHGGLTFGGGPIADYMTHATAAMVRRLRQEGGRGLLFGNGGHCTHNHAIVLGREPPAKPLHPQNYDVQAEADAARGPTPTLTDDHEGPVTLETYTVVYDRAGDPAYGVVLSRNDEGLRVIARVPPTDAETLAFLTDGLQEPVGSNGVTRRDGDVLVWTPA